MNYYSICYVSTAREGISTIEIESILSSTAINNDKNNVKGILLHDLGHFFQVLEGDETHVKALFENIICKDSRHKDISTIFENRVEETLFSTYNSKFNVVKTTEELELIKRYLIKKTGNASDKVLRILRPFLLYQVC